MISVILDWRGLVIAEEIRCITWLNVKISISIDNRNVNVVIIGRVGLAHYYKRIDVLLILGVIHNRWDEEGERYNCPNYYR